MLMQLLRPAFCAGSLPLPRIALSARPLSPALHYPHRLCLPHLALRIRVSHSPPSVFRTSHLKHPTVQLLVHRVPNRPSARLSALERPKHHACPQASSYPNRPIARMSERQTAQPPKCSEHPAAQLLVHPNTNVQQSKRSNASRLLNAPRIPSTFSRTPPCLF